MPLSLTYPYDGAVVLIDVISPMQYELHYDGFHQTYSDVDIIMLHDPVIQGKSLAEIADQLELEAL